MSRFLVAIDPGIRGCGVACFTDGVLDRAAYVRSSVKSGTGTAAAVAMARAVEDWYAGEADEVATEWPRVYATRISRGEMNKNADPNDLLGLAAVDVGVAILLAPNGRYAHYAPSEWKGQMPKEVCEARVRRRMSEAELAVMAEVRPASLAHNVWDAVGIGMHHLGRLAPRRA